jgi:hypothetical protein
VIGIVGWPFRLSGATGEMTTYWARQTPGFGWSLVSAALPVLAGIGTLEKR